LDEGRWNYLRRPFVFATQMRSHIALSRSSEGAIDKASDAREAIKVHEGEPGK
jgi:hypothetical protein